ncbi:cell wall protein TIR4-like [Limulus polyphemus]|uniref:Cell wall protein TIR4-like n=1 Tax=Limulus polyphemus TaxID=6850 RepID=A0ABM1T6P3_LIMPO|nr:cell wall protein TIR4-like [Limulus polyphemus]
MTAKLSTTTVVPTTGELSTKTVEPRTAELSTTTVGSTIEELSTKTVEPRTAEVSTKTVGSTIEELSTTTIEPRTAELSTTTVGPTTRAGTTVETLPTTTAGTTIEELSTTTTKELISAADSPSTILRSNKSLHPTSETTLERTTETAIETQKTEIQGKVSNSPTTTSAQILLKSMTPKSSSSTSPTSMTPIDVFFKLAEDFYSVVGSQQSVFTSHLLFQLAIVMRLPLSCFYYFNISPGSIDVKFGLIPYNDNVTIIDEAGLQDATSQLMQKINSGELKLTDLNGNQLTVVQLSPTVTTTPLPSGISLDFTPIILGILIGVFILMVVLIIMTAVIVKQMNRATSRVTPLEASIKIYL